VPQCDEGDLMIDAQDHHALRKYKIEAGMRGSRLRYRSGASNADCIDDMSLNLVCDIMSCTSTRYRYGAIATYKR
jgi:hypothetical protein